MTNQEALIIEAFFGSVLGLYLLRLQRLDTEQIQEIITKIDKREMKRKQLWVKIVLDGLHLTKTQLETLHKYYVRFSQDHNIEANLDDEMRQFALMATHEVRYEELDTALNYLLELLDEPSLFTDTKKHFAEIKWHIENAYGDHRQLTSSARLERLTDRLNQLIKNSDNFVVKFEKESPKIDLQVLK